LDKHFFINRIRSLLDISGALLPELTAAEQVQFERDRVGYLEQCSDDHALAICREIEKLQPPKPPWINSKISAAPKIRQIYWCEYWGDARLPEMWKTRPVIVVSYKNTLFGPCLAIPTSTDPENAKDPFGVQLSIDIEGNGVTSWAVCNHPVTVSPSRFSQFKGSIPILPKADFNKVLEKLNKLLPVPFV
jgi:mRNA interferase MazF